MNDFVNLIGRILIAFLFAAGAVQKVSDPVPVQQMIASLGLSPGLVWGVALFDLVAAIALVTGPGVRFWAVLLALYCAVTSWFHFQLRADPWQITIMVKNWAIAGGLLILAAQGPGRFAMRRKRGRR